MKERERDGQPREGWMAGSEMNKIMNRKRKREREKESGQWQRERDGWLKEIWKERERERSKESGQDRERDG